MRYYIYISDAKVDMLLPQIPGAVRKTISAKLGFDIKVLSASLESEGSTLDNRISRLKAVEEHLRKEEMIGAPHDQVSWIQGVTDAKLIDIGDGAVLFISTTPQLVLVLGGSAHHLIGTDLEKVPIPFSNLYSLINRLKDVVDREIEQLPEGRPNHSISNDSDGFDDWVAMFHWARDHAKVPTQRIEFLAKRLASKETFLTKRRDPTEAAKRVMLTMATPLFVALDE